MTANSTGESTRTPPHEAIEYLVGSWNRFDVLDTISDEPRTRDELIENTGVSRPTLSRILSDLTDRGWIVRHNAEFETTAKGAVIAMEVEKFVNNIEAADSLDATLRWLPTELLGFDIAHLRDSEVLTASFDDQTGPMRRFADYIAEADQMRTVATGVTYEIVAAICQAATDGELTMQAVLDDRGLDAVRSHTDLAVKFNEMVSVGQSEVYHYPARRDLIDCNLLGDVVMFCGHSDDGRPAGILLSEDETVRSWMTYYFERVRDDATRLTPEAFTA